MLHSNFLRCRMQERTLASTVIKSGEANKQISLSSRYEQKVIKISSKNRTCNQASAIIFLFSVTKDDCANSVQEATDDNSRIEIANSCIPKFFPRLNCAIN